MILDFPKTKYTVKVKQVHLNSQSYGNQIPRYVLCTSVENVFYSFLLRLLLLLLNHLCNALRVSLTCTVIASYEFR